MAFLFKLVAKPLLLVILSCQFGLQCVCIVMIQMWIELLRAALYLQLEILWRSAIWVISILSLPLRALAAPYKEKRLHMQLCRVTTELEEVLWERKELEKQLHMAIKDCRMIDAILTELRNEHHDAVVQIELLGVEVRDLRDEIRRVKELESQSLSDDKGEDKEEKGNYTKTNVNINHNVSTESVRDHDMKDIKNQPKSQWPAEQHVAGTVSKGAAVWTKQRDLALSQSLFSAILAMVVGIVVWEAKDPCMPLILAIFTVVAMSLSSMVKFFSTIQHKPTSDAVALLSFNWFMLGILMFLVAEHASVLCPFASRFLG